MCRVRSSSLTVSSSTVTTTTTPTTTIAVSRVTTTASSAAATSDAVADANQGMAALENNSASVTASTTDAGSNYHAAYAAPSSVTSTASTSAAASVASTSSATSSSSGGSGTGRMNSGSKFGAAWPNGGWASQGDADYIGNYVGSRTSWYYTWSPSNIVSILLYYPSSQAETISNRLQQTRSAWSSCRCSGVLVRSLIGVRSSPAGLLSRTRCSSM